MLLDGQPVPPEVLELEPEYFSIARHADVWDAIQGQLIDRNPTDEVSVLKRMKADGSDGKGSYLLEMTAKTPSTVNLDHWARYVVDAGRKRITEQRVVDAAKGNPDAATLVARVKEIETEMSKWERNRGLIHVSEPLRALAQELQDEANRPGSRRVASTGIPAYDHKVEMRAGQLTILAGRPGMGKSALMGNIAAHAAKSGTVAVFSLEMNAVQLVARLIQARCDLSAPKLIDWSKYSNTCGRLFSLPLYIDDRAGLAVEDMRASLTRLPDVQLVMVDYLQLSRTQERLERQDLRVGAISKALKKLSKDFECHVVALCQLNRQTEQQEGKRPAMANLRNSGELEEDADIVTFVYRPAVYNSNEDREKAELIIGKNRFGGVGTVHCRWDETRQLFFEEARTWSS